MRYTNRVGAFIHRHIQEIVNSFRGIQERYGEGQEKSSSREEDGNRTGAARSGERQVAADFSAGSFQVSDYRSIGSSDGRYRVYRAASGGCRGRAGKIGRASCRERV